METLITTILIGLSTVFSFAILRWKFEHGRWDDALLDLSMMVIFMYYFSGSFQGTATAMVVSTLISVYLIFNPFKLVFGDMAKFKAKFTTLAKRVTYTLLAIAIVSVVSFISIKVFLYF